MVKIIERVLRRLFPELFSGYHLPMLAKVIAVADSPTAPGIVNEFRPRFAVDIQILNQDGSIDQELPAYKGIALPVQMAGLDQGMWGFPQPGSTVEVAFAYGNPNKPFIRSVLSFESTCPEVSQGEQVWQHSPGIEQRADTAGNWTRQTDKSIQDKSTTRNIESLDDVQKYLQSTITVGTNSIENVGATKSIEAMGAIRLNAGEQAILLALKDLKIATNATLHTYSKDNTEVKTDAKLNAVAKTLVHIEATEGKVWLGSSSVNSIQILVDLIGVVSALANTLATHTHPGVPLPTETAAILGHKSQADTLKSTLEPITE